MTGAADRMPRLLALVPYLLARPGVAVAQVAADFGVTEQQLRRDLNLLWMCGLPGQGPGDLIDLSFDGDTVSVIFDAGMSRPLRLTAEEALALIVALRTLAETPGIIDRDVVERALAKVESAAGGHVDAADAVQVALDAEARARPVVQVALDEFRALELRYFTAGRDETTERVVDPIRLFSSEGRTYLEAWCRRAEGLRVFRLDRIEAAVVLDEPASVPSHVQPRELSEGVYDPAPEHLLVDLLLGPAYAWVAEHYVIETESTSDAGPSGQPARVGPGVGARAGAQLVRGRDGVVAAVAGRGHPRLGPDGAGRLPLKIGPTRTAERPLAPSPSGRAGTSSYEGRGPKGDSRVPEVIGWLAVGGALIFALIVLGFCVYEVLWRVRRLQRDARLITDLAPEVAALQRRLELLQRRTTAAAPSADMAGDH